jgi:Holliday junction resolvase RusA-like endonuclease
VPFQDIAKGFMMKTVIHLQHLPPSLNNMYANVPGKGRIKSDRYRTWRSAAGWDIKAQRLHNWTEPVFLQLTFGGLRSNADVSNRIKAIEDLLVEHGIIQGDTIMHVPWVQARAVPASYMKGVEIVITAAEPCQEAA